MIIIRENDIPNIFEFKYGSELLEKPEEEVAKTINYLMSMQHIYDSAIKEVTTKLKILDNEFKVKNFHNPIHSLDSRLKKPYSIIGKLQKKGLSEDIFNAEEHLYDIAGIRVICSYISDVYLIEEFLLKQDDVTLIKRKDYIENPKVNGYRSLHLVISIPVFLSNETKHVPVEIQIRTIAMDFWATLEHQLKYKSRAEGVDAIKDDLLACANQVAELDSKMEEIYFKIYSDN